MVFTFLSSGSVRCQSEVCYNDSVQCNGIPWVITALLCSVESLQVQLFTLDPSDCISLNPLPHHTCNSRSKPDDSASFHYKNSGYFFSALKSKRKVVKSLQVLREKVLLPGMLSSSFCCALSLVPRRSASERGLFCGASFPLGQNVSRNILM